MGVREELSPAESAVFGRCRRGWEPTQPSVGESLWIIRRNGVRWSCELYFRGESYGWEAQILRNGELVIARRFALRRLAYQPDGRR